jgi:hypothetical protein
MIIIAVIIGQTGPDMELLKRVYAYNCNDANHSAPCDGGVEVGKAWSNPMTLTTRPLNKRWYCYVTPYLNNNATAIQYEVLIYIHIQGRSNSQSWKTLTNTSEISYLPCYEDNYRQCSYFLLVYEPNIKYDEYSLSVRFAKTNGEDLLDLGDVEFTLGIDNPDFSTLALILKLLLLVINILIIAFHYFRLRGKKNLLAIMDR